ncbi:MAG TPA: L-rhamnose isomerase [Candidatus Sulfotelmatobacter sp.]|nr:L-rhamnose isomerase [Candidatus Sulfotelmatobacter sp.]HWI59621.1 L-rhamnose isomerase [Bacillota bacterium]
MSTTKNIERSYQLAKERYAQLGVDTDKALEQLAGIPISIHCWQGDDVGGFENAGSALGGGLAVTGNYPGKARTPQELRGDFEKALSLIPGGSPRFNLHACYAEMNGTKVDRDVLSVDQFKNWIAWAKSRNIGLDFNQTYFAHPKAADGMTLSHPDKAIRKFWVEHGIRCREIAGEIGKALGKTCLTNLWIPDGMKDTPADRKAPRERLAQALDAIFKKKIDKKYNVDSVEPKLFGIGSESYVVGSHEFYMGYAVSRQILLTLDAGHYHPTEGIADKISSVLLYLPEIALHVSRGVRWDSDHVVTLTDDLQAIAQEIVWGGNLGRVRIGLDYFDASINRVAAWVIGTRNMSKALLLALVAPIDRIKACEVAGDYTARLALQEEAKSLPSGPVWDYFCYRQGVPVGAAWLAEVKDYERTVLAKRV